MNILKPELNDYLHSLTPTQDPVLKKMELLADKKEFPIIGPLVGRLLWQLALLTKAKRILELGSGFGYSAIWFSKGIHPTGQILCTDGSNENASLAAQFFKQAQIENMVQYCVCDALSVLNQDSGLFDIILNDVDKHEYPKVFSLAVPLLKKGGLLITDNTLWQGRVIDTNPSPSTVGIQRFNKLSYESPLVLTTLLPLRDGVTVSLKL